MRVDDAKVALDTSSSGIGGVALMSAASFWILIAGCFALLGIWIPDVSMYSQNGTISSVSWIFFVGMVALGCKRYVNARAKRRI
jgi:hypothetical protein